MIEVPFVFMDAGEWKTSGVMYVSPKDICAIVPVQKADNIWQIRLISGPTLHTGKRGLEHILENVDFEALPAW